MYTDKYSDRGNELIGLPRKEQLAAH